MIELFAGSSVMASTFEREGFEVFTVDLENNGEGFRDIDLEIDVMALDALQLPSEPAVVWASPPCTAYSFARHKDRCFGPGGVPLNDEADQSNLLVKKTLRIIEQLDPTYWFLENPKAYLGMQPFMQPHPFSFVSYCNYGSEMKKPTQIWGRHPIHWHPKAHCSHARHTHWHDHPKSERAIIPQDLCDEIVEAVIKSKGASSFVTLTEWIQ